jgi:hypothetical protein
MFQIYFEALAEENEEVQKDTFHYQMRPVLFLARLFGLLPIHGVAERSPQGLR